jgi:hypothetical protein
MVINFLLGFLISFGFASTYIGCIKLIIKEKYSMQLITGGLISSIFGSWFVRDVSTNQSIEGWRVGVFIFNIVTIITIIYLVSKLRVKKQKFRKNNPVKNNYLGLIMTTIAFAVLVNFSYFIFVGFTNWVQRIFGIF